MLTAEQLFYLKEINHAVEQGKKRLSPKEQALLKYIAKGSSLSFQVSKELQKLHERCTELVRIKR